jgi:hypothetical protein
MKTFNLRKVSEGKNKRSAVNAIKNTLCHCIVAVIRRGRPFVPEFKKIRRKSLQES